MLSKSSCLGITLSITKQKKKRRRAYESVQHGTTEWLFSLRFQSLVPTRWTSLRRPPNLWHARTHAVNGSASEHPLRVEHLFADAGTSQLTISVPMFRHGNRYGTQDVYEVRNTCPTKSGWTPAKTKCAPFAEKATKIVRSRGGQGGRNHRGVVCANSRAVRKAQSV